MMGRWTLLILALFSSYVVDLSARQCPLGFMSSKKACIDFNECGNEDDYPLDIGQCGEDAKCFNTIGSYYCQCEDGFRSPTHTQNFTAENGTCKDINECLETIGICGANAKCFNTAPLYSCICDDGFLPSTGVEMFRHGSNVTCTDLNECQEENVCGQNASCVNTYGSFYCVCNAGFELKSGGYNFSGHLEQCEDICLIDKTICGNGTCHQGVSGQYCACHSGYTNYGNEKSRCVDLNCSVFKDANNLEENFPATHDLIKQLEAGCVGLAESEDPRVLDGEDILNKLLSMIDDVLSSGVFTDNRKLSTFLDLVENALRLIGPFIQPPGTNRTFTHTELDLLVHKGPLLPQGVRSFSSKHSQLDIQLETAAGDPSHYPGFTTVSLLSYLSLEESADGFFRGMKPQKGQSFKINSKVVTITVSNRNTSHLTEPVNITFYHLKQTNQSSHTCVFWNSSEEGGTWSPQGCKVMESNLEFTVCSCSHLSSFAVLMALYDMEDPFELQLITFVGLSLSLVCLFLCILTFSLIRSIQSPRTSIHLHLCISLFIATLIFVTCISRTENQVGCAVVAGLLQFFFLASFCWMCLEGIQLFRMVVLVFNTNFKTLYMMAGGYGVPAVIVAITALSNAEGYGTNKYCWLNLDIIWSFFGPACVIILVNIFFFLITVWKLAEKFSSLNPDLDNLQKIKTFTITAVAQLCVLGTMWIFGCFQFDEGTIVLSYLFTIFGSLQGVLLFVMHCLFSKQVRDEYANILSKCCAPKKKLYSEFSHSSKAQASKSSQDTGESHI